MFVDLYGTAPRYICFTHTYDQSIKKKDQRGMNYHKWGEGGGRRERKPPKDKKELRGKNRLNGCPGKENLQNALAVLPEIVPYKYKDSTDTRRDVFIKCQCSWSIYQK